MKEREQILWVAVWILKISGCLVAGNRDDHAETP